jgi:hypothetical protein
MTGLFLLLVLLNPSLVSEEVGVGEIVIVYSFGYKGIDRLDTELGTMTLDRVVDPPMTIPLHLSQAELESIVALADSIGFFGLPGVIREPDSLMHQCGTTCDSEHTLAIMWGSRNHTVKWICRAFCKATPVHHRMERLGAFIEGIIFSKPEYRRVPRPKAARI